MKNLRTIKNVFAFLLILTLSGSCSKDGADGAPGKDGINGTDASITNTGFETTSFAVQVIPNTTNTKVNFENEIYDPSNSFFPLTSAFVIPTTGFYHFDVSVAYFTSMPTNFVVMNLLKNGEIYKTSSQTASGQVRMNIAVNAVFQANDVLAVYTIQNTGASATLSTGTNVSFSGYRVY